MASPLAIYIGLGFALISAAALALRGLNADVQSRYALVAFAVVMWVPALARLLTVSTVDQGWQSPLPIDFSWTGLVSTMWLPAAIELGIYGVAYGMGAASGVVSWNPPWSGVRLAANVAINVMILSVVGMVGSAGEELGWRGYLQPKLDERGVAASTVVVGLIWAAFHLPLVLLAGYQRTARPWWTFGFFTVNCVADSFVWATYTYRSGNLLTAIWFHTFHNTFGQWLFPRLFPSKAGSVLLGEAGVLSMTAHVIAAVLVWFEGSRR